MATVFKSAPPDEWFVLEGVDFEVRAWSKVIEAGGEEREWWQQKKQRPPMAPSAFEALLKTLTFTNG